MYTCLTFVFGPEFLPILGTGGLFLFVDFRVRPFQKVTTCEDEILLLSKSDSLSGKKYLCFSTFYYPVCYSHYVTFQTSLGSLIRTLSCILRNELWQEEKK